MGNPVVMSLEQENGNAFSLMGAFAAKARQSGWTQAEIKAVHAEAMSGDYDHLLQTLIKHTIHPGDAGEGEADA